MLTHQPLLSCRPVCVCAGWIDGRAVSLKVEFERRGES